MTNDQARSELNKVWTVPPKTSMELTPHHLCAGCGEPIAYRIISEVIDELGLRQDTIQVSGIGCYSAIDGLMMHDRINALHGRAPSVATGVKRMLPDRLVFTVQGDGDMVSEGIAEAIHCAARGENFTAIMLNNMVNGETGGHMTATTMVGHKTKSSLEGRDAKVHGKPIKTAELLAQLEGCAYSARGGVHNPAAVKRTKRLIRTAFEVQQQGLGFSFVEILSMCPTGWFMKPWEAPQFMEERMTKYFTLGEFKVPGPEEA